MSPAAVKMDDSKGGAAMEARFADFCKTGLALDESTARQAMDLFKETNHILLDNMMTIDTGSPAEMELLLFAFVLYCVVRLGQGRDKLEHSGVSLPQILKAAKLKSRDFFKEMPQFSIQAGFVLTSLYGSDWEKRLGLKELQASIMHLSLLRRHYKRSYHKFFLTSETSSNQHTSVCGSAEYISDYHRFGWLLFLALRVHDFGRFEDLVTCTNGLVSIMAILILHVPICFRNFSIQDSPSFAKKSGKGIDLLASLSDIYDTSEEELRRTMAKVNKLIINLLEKKPCPASECKKESLDHVDPDGLTYFDNLLEGNSLQSCLLILENDYDYAIRNKGEVDECLLIDDESSLLSPESLSGGAINITGTKRKFDEIASPTKRITSSLSPPCSPVNGNLVSNSRVPATTPVSTAMTTAKWLRTVISPLPSKPSVELERFLSSCDKNVTSDVTRRAYIVLEAIFSSSYFGERCISGCWESMSLTESTWAEQRKMEALKLYYRVLEAICRAESHRLHGNNLTSLLTSEQFHRCMLACSAELVLATYKTITLTFPVVLEKSGITAFDLSKVIESFIRHEETLPRELKRHLNFLEERLLESMVWEKGSSMYNSLIVARPALSGEINRLGLLAEPLPSLDAIAMHHNIQTAGLPPLPFQKRDTSSDQNGDAQSPQKVRGEHRTVLVEHNLFRSPIKERLLTFNSLKSKTPPLQSAFATPTRQNPAGGETCAETGINVFISKILKLAAQRVRGLCERLKLSQQTLDCVYCLIKQILGHRISIFFNRHIDQIIICCFYGIVKIHQLSLTFKDIIYTYKTQPQCKSQVYQSVFVSCPPTSRNRRTGQEHVTIINFYNAVFVPCVKDLLLELGPSQKSRGHDDNKNNDDGQIPGSPRLPPFPYLPDMSPKKVSASHNVFVSPIRSSSKMDALLSPSSRSYYACVGESTLAYQSPSADLSVINKHLSCSRKIGGKLNFDLVSDAVVARSFGQQNGSSVSSVATTMNNPPMKQEQPDSQ